MARIAPSGYYCASADVAGNSAFLLSLCPQSRANDLIVSRILVRVWDTAGDEQILKAEYKIISGRMCVLFVFLAF